VWLDETYVDYVGKDESLETFAGCTPNVLVCKSMSKVYALSGVRAAYLCGYPDTVERIRAITPPWAVSLPAQVAVVKALKDPEYYTNLYRETDRLRRALATQLWQLGVEVIDGSANFLLCHLPEKDPDAATVIGRCRFRKLFLRGFGNSSLGKYAFRIAVKDEQTNLRMTKILKWAIERD
jgi:histidinol-phosphate/aromatic aminotransferase/cobyric acid decarboxylase-like protein